MLGDLTIVVTCVTCYALHMTRKLAIGTVTIVAWMYLFAGAVVGSYFATAWSQGFDANARLDISQIVDER